MVAFEFTNPALVLVALLIGAKAGGIVGIFFAVPMTVMLMTLLQEWRVYPITSEDKAPGNEPMNIDRLPAQKEQERLI